METRTMAEYRDYISNAIEVFEYKNIQGYVLILNQEVDLDYVKMAKSECDLKGSGWEVFNTDSNWEINKATSKNSPKELIRFFDNLDRFSQTESDPSDIFVTYHI